jgi:hypothetical protein
MSRYNLTAERLRHLVNYDSSTGIFTWRISRPRCAVGGRAGHFAEDGYWTIRIDGHLYEAQRLAWLHFYGEWPIPSIDHINRITDDNRIENLRLANKQQNGANRKVQKNSKSGVKGVSRHGLGWRAKITINGQFHLLGTFKDIEDARNAYLAAAEKLFGEYAYADPGQKSQGELVA